jgi:hypothetical protein
MFHAVFTEITIFLFIIYRPRSRHFTIGLTNTRLRENLGKEPAISMRYEWKSGLLRAGGEFPRCVRVPGREATEDSLTAAAIGDRLLFDPRLEHQDVP